MIHLLTSSTSSTNKEALINLLRWKFLTSTNLSLRASPESRVSKEEDVACSLSSLPGALHRRHVDDREDARLEVK